MRRNLLFIFLWLTVSGIFGQNAPVYHPIEINEWEKAVDGLTYVEEKQEMELRDKERPDRNLSINTQIFQIVGFILIAAILVFILLKLFGNGMFFNKKVDVIHKTTLHELDERPMETDLERFLREALENKDYKLAIRIYYLMLLRILHDKNLIEWKRNKTNMDYLAEVRKHPAYHQLSNNTLLYELIWYGERTVAESQFTNMQVSYTELLKQLKNGN